MKVSLLNDSSPKTHTSIPNLISPQHYGKITVRKRVSVPHAMKHAIVTEAYANSRSIRRVARKYQVQPEKF